MVQVVKNLPAYAGDVGSIPGLGRNLGKGNGDLLQYSCLKNWMDKGVWWAIAHGVTKNWTQLSNWAHTHTTHCMELYHTTNAPTFSYTFSLCWRTFRVFPTFHYNKYAVVNTLNAHLLYMGEVLCGKISSIEMSGWRTWMLQFGFLVLNFLLKVCTSYITLELTWMLFFKCLPALEITNLYNFATLMDKEKKSCCLFNLNFLIS